MHKKVLLTFCILVLALLACGESVPAIEYDARDEIEILSHNHRRDSIGNLIIEGEIQNNGPHIWRFVELSATGYDASEAVIDTGTSFADTERLRVGDTSTFKIYIDEEGRGITTYKVRIIGGKWEE